ncbi:MULTISPECIES: hypothetical protein [Methylobacterium]|uniref:Uncharacterized protein n=1 Tax=Methylobacterium jeotgali TaxID=381630 RepID=A0ABQ4SWL4_9HYPH|nr:MULTISPECIES: hypothetical protein [Methylobacterium]PIU06279.1 MAG: hypothetical protein COT56_10700 [Methylobacterium sp. CG09_land_8_20_14_0_10_71_15]PIU11170.1 MAG: hypothetical protein COT28_21395 [Methylobacterium sp. CG08_land_8_20_14_0_20_71_15]GBU19557.1 hypothetical protein AwMethylo_37720 [Methylobacterium sp.]GJE07547.1 hypothetical protein AOPFMNJM_2876 [Methylobacterium jeotgali]
MTKPQEKSAPSRAEEAMAAAPAAHLDRPLVLGIGAGTLGFHPPDVDGRLVYRWSGPEPSSAILYGAVPEGARRISLVLARPVPAALAGRVRVSVDGQPVPVEAGPADAPGLPEGLTALSGPITPAPADTRGLRIDIRLDHTMPEPGAERPERLVGLAVHAVLFTR